MVRILHLSDFHLSQETLQDMNLVITSLIADLQIFHKTLPIDLVIFSGDLIDKGGISFSDIEMAFLTFEDIIIRPILQALKLPSSRFLFAPGNHDIDRTADKPVEEIGLENYLSDNAIVNRYIDTDDPQGRKRILKFKEFETSFYKNENNSSVLTTFGSSFKLFVNDLNIGITCLNSSWRCYDSNKDKGKIIVGERQITNATTFLEDCDIKLAVSHHAFDWLAPFESKVTENLITKEYDLFFCGHVHEGSSWVKSTMHGELFVSIAPANWTIDLRTTDRIHSNGYSIVDYDHEFKIVKMYNRRYSHEKRCFDPNPDLGDHQGIVNYSFPDSDELDRKRFRKEVAETLWHNHIEDINQHLISHSTDTNAPKDIEHMFVMPKIVEKTQYRTDRDDQEIVFQLDDLCSTKEHLLLLGGKESGKTILLDKVLLEITKNVDKYKRIPVYIDFEEFKSSRIETAISKFLGISVKDVKDKINNNTTVLLIDNLSFSLSKKQTLHMLENFIEDNPNLFVIATCGSSVSGEVPLDILDYHVFSNFRTSTIKSFKVKEIRELAKNWFSNYHDYDTSNKINNIVKMFSTLNIPSTPLAISMFLWIIEQQENYKPINNATMLANFIERLFKKTSKTEIYSDIFDFKNKERLLSEIALKMHNKGDVNYRLDYREIRDFIYEYLKLRKFDFRGEDVLQHFLEKGIFIINRTEGEEHVRFRFTCFFEFFLMKNMEQSSEFKAFVLDKDNYLFFIEEIDYYTGLKRDETSILQELVSRMNESFSEIQSKIAELKYGYDTIFETKNSIASTLDNSFVQTVTGSKPTERDLDDIQDNMLDGIEPEKGIAKKDEDISLFERLDRTWTIAGMVLKNTEETTIENFKSDCFQSVLRCAMAFSIVYKMLLVDYKQKNENTGISEKLSTIDRFFPLVFQLVTYNVVGTGKLSVVIRESIEASLDREDVSDFEKYLLVFLYADLKAKDYQSYFMRLIRKTRMSYIKDMILFKLISYYFLRSESRSMNRFYEGLIQKVIDESRGVSNVSNQISTKHQNALPFNTRGRELRKIKLQKKKKLHQEAST